MSGPFRKFGRKLVENGYAVIPIPPGTKGPVFDGWQDTRLTSAKDFDKFLTGTRKVTRHKDGVVVEVPNVGTNDGIGIITRDNPAIDIDCLDQGIVDHMVAWCKTNIGEAPVRVGKAPKALLLYATDKPFRKVTSARFYDPENPELDPKRNGQRLEILGDGQQFVAFHTHPDTGKPYVWTEDFEDPLNIPALDLTIITHEDAEEACREFERMCEAAGWERLGGGTTGHEGEYDAADALAELEPPEESEIEVERVRSALAAMAEHASDYDYDEWRNVLFSLKWTRWDCAEALAREWSENSDKHVTKTFNVVWRGAQKRERGREVTLGTLFTMAKALGWDASRAPTPAATQAAYEELLQEATQLADVEKTVPATAAIIAKMAQATLVGSAEGAILKEIKRHTGFSIADLRRDLLKARKAHVKEVDHMATHAGYAAKLVELQEEKSGVKPVAVEGMIYTYSEGKGIWRGVLTHDFAVKVANLFDGQENCSRRTDYTAIAQHTYSMLSDGREDFFSSAPVGLACTGRFYRLNKDGEIEREELDHTHRQRVLSPFKPVVGPMPLFTQFLADTFQGDVDTEQRDLLQEVIGAVMLGLMARLEKVVLLKGPGRSGKGTIMKIIEAMLPREVRAAVSPFNWDSEYYLANLAGKRLNLVGELPDDEPIPAANFKTLTGRDTLTGRHPSGRPFEFRNEAAHIFSTNHFVYTKDHTEAFYSRWVMLEFKNSRVGRENEQIVDLAQRIIDTELPAIMAWALQGAKRLQDRGYFPTTKVQMKLMAAWRHRTNTLIEFLLDREVTVLGNTKQHMVRRSDFYRAYVEWCKASNRRPVGKMKLYDELATAGIGNLGVTLGVSNGADVLRGVALLSEIGWVETPDDDEL